MKGFRDGNYAGKLKGMYLTKVYVFVKFVI